MTKFRSRDATIRWQIIFLFICFLHSSFGIAQAQNKSKISPTDLELIKQDKDGDGEPDVIGDTVTVSGISNIATGVLHENYMQVFIQNDSTGLSLFSRSFDKPIATGDSVVATGIVQKYYGLTEINVIKYEVYPNSGTLPTPYPLNDAVENPQKYEGMLVEGTATVVSKGDRFNGKYLLASPDDAMEKSIMLYVTNFHSMYQDFDFESISIGDNLNISGVLSKYNPDPSKRDDIKYKVHLRTPRDVAISGISINQMILWGSIGLALFLIIVGWILSLRSTVKSKTKELKESLEEKEILLKEIHHRVKNNLAIMSGLFELQLDGTESKETKKALRNSQSRLQSMALVHDKLYQTSSLNNIEMQNYIPELVRSLHDTFAGPDQKIELKFNIEDIRLNIDQAIPCGLLINEIVVNAFKHAFNKNEAGLISITMKQRHNNVELTIADNGNGIPDDFDIEQSSSLGMMLIETFKKQLEATLELTNKEGTRFEFEFHI